MWDNPNLKKALTGAAILYFFAMGFLPWTQGQYSWTYLQNVWDRWQGFNVGVLAFASALIALYASRYNELRKELREKEAARAMLRFTLHDLSHYCQQSYEILKEARDHVHENDNAPAALQPSKSTPTIPPAAVENLDRCMKCFDERNAVKISEIMHELQVQHARMVGIIEKLTSPEPGHLFIVNNVDVPLCTTIHLHSKINDTFAYARGIQRQIPDYGRQETINNILTMYFRGSPKYDELYLRMGVEID